MKKKNSAQVLGKDAAGAHASAPRPILKKKEKRKEKNNAQVERDFARDHGL